MFKNNKTLTVIAAIAVVNALGYGIVIPLLYSYSVKYGLNDFQNGLLLAVYSVCQFFSTPVIGRLSDKYGRRPMLMLSIGGTALSFFIMAFAPNAIFLFLARALDGITAGNMPVAAAVISDSLKPEDRAKGFGVMSASFNFGFVFGPAIAAFTVRYGLTVPLIIAGVVTVLAVLITAFLLDESNKHIGQTEHKSLFNFGGLIHALGNKAVGATLIMTLCYFMAFFMFIYAFQSGSVKIFHLHPEQVSYIFTLFGLAGVVAQYLLIGRTIKMFGEKKTFLISVLVIAVNFIIMFFLRNVILFVICNIVLALLNAFIQPISQNIISQETDPKEQGEMQGINSSYMSIGMIFGPIIAGAFATYSVGLPFLAAGLLTFVSYYLSLRIFAHLPQKKA